MMRWITEVWHQLFQPRSIDEGMNGLWLASHDVRRGVSALIRTRHQLQMAQHRNQRVVRKLEHTVHDLERHRKLPPITPPKDHD